MPWTVQARRWNLPPLVLQELFENAVKHNTFDRHLRSTRIEVREAICWSAIGSAHVSRLSNRRDWGWRNLDERMRLVGRPLQWGYCWRPVRRGKPLAQAEAVAQPATDRVGRQIAS